jgi:hypothetical protein
MDYNSLAANADLDDIIVGERPPRKKNSSQETWNTDDSFPPRTKRHYIGTEHYLAASAIKWYREKTGFPVPVEHCDYFFTLPFGFAKELITLPAGQTNVQYESGIAFCHKDGEIFQYRPFKPLPSWEMVDGEWVPGRPIKYFSISREKLGADGITPVKIPPKPLFLPKLRDYPNSPNVLVVTEGFTKAACLSHLGFDSIHLPGVTLWNTPSAQEVLKSHQGKYDYFVLAFDSDSQSNMSVKREQMKFAKTYNARIAQWQKPAGETPKGFDDLCLEVGIEDVKFLRWVIINAKAPDTGYLVSNRQTPYPTMVEAISEAHPKLFFDGRYWINQGQRIPKSEVDKLLIHELQKFYVIGKMGKEYLWATKYKEALEYIYLHLTHSDTTNVTFLSNGYIDGGEFYPSSVTDPRALPWERLETYDEPTELINFLHTSHGGENYRYWLRSLFDNSIPYGAILGVTGESGSGKSVTLSIAQALLGELHCQHSSLLIFETNERIAGLGNPKALIQSDCQKLPEKMDELFVFTDSSPISVRSLYQTGYELRRFYCRVAFGFVNLPYVAGANEGFSRRFKLITCQKFTNMQEDIKRLVELLKDSDYLNRIFNWVMDASPTKTLQFMNPTAADGVSAELKAQGTYKFFDQTLIPLPPREEITVREYYEGYQIYCNRQRKRIASYDDFLSTMKRVGIPTLPGANVRLPGGTFITTDDILNVRVDERVMSIIRLNTGNFFGINTKYFHSRDTQEKWAQLQDIQNCHIFFTREPFEDDIQEDGGEIIVTNPTIPLLNDITTKYQIISVNVPHDYKFQHPLLQRVINSIQLNLTPSKD